MRRIFIALIGAVMVLPLNAQNIIRPKIACPNGLWVNSYNGVLFFTRVDVTMANTALPIQLQFYYNSSYNSKNYGYGFGFSLGYEMRYTVDETGISIERGDGRKDHYKKYDNVYEAPSGVFDQLTEYESGKFLLIMKGGSKYYFDDATHKRVTKITDRNDNATTLTYQNGLLTGISDSGGRTMTLTYSNSMLTRVSASFAKGDYMYQYDAKQRLTKITDAMGYSTLYAYDTKDRLTSITDANGNKTQIYYTSSGAVNRVKTAVTDKVIRYEKDAMRTVIVDYTEPANQFTYYVWDEKGRVIEKTGSCCGQQERLEYDNNDNVIKRVDANGNERTFTYDNNGNMLSATDAEGNIERYTYELTYNQITTYTDKNRGLYQFTYDTKGNLLQLSGPEGYLNVYTYNDKGLPLTITDGRGNVTQNVYATTGLLTSQTDAAGNVRVFEYDNAGNLISTTDVRQFVTAYAYNNNNWLTSVTDALKNSTDFSYDRCGNVVRIKDAINHITANTYDPLGRLLSTTDPVGKSMKYIYNGKGKPIAVINQANDTVKIAYDGSDRMISITNAAKETVALDYDKKGNLITVTQPNGNVISYGYTSNDLVDIITDSEGLINKQTFDGNGNVLTQEDGEGRLTRYEYDALNRVVSITDPLNNSDVYAYDANSNLVSFTNRNGYLESYEYDALNRITEVTDALSYKTKYQYDEGGNLITAIDAKNNVTTYTYDALGRNTHITFANGTAMQYWYDALGNVTQMKDRNGAEIKYNYDALNQLISKVYPDGKSDRFGYDNIGQLISAINENATVTIDYDKAGRVISETLNGKVTSYSYDIANRKRTITYPGSKQVEELLNVRDQIVQISEDGTIVVNMSYNNSGQLLTRTYGNGTSTTLAYNENGWLSRMTDGPNISDVTLSYDKMGNIISRVDYLKSEHSELYGYDEIQRLVGFARGAISGSEVPNPLKDISYRYDALGNRTIVQEDGVTTNYTANAMNEYTGISGGYNATPQYDRNGNMLNDQDHTYQYDYNNMLVKVGNNTATYLYDALGRRISKETSEGKVEFYYAGERLIEEYDTSVLNNYIYGDNSSDIVKSNIGFYHKDQLNSVSAISGTDGIIERYLYKPFGAVAHFDKDWTSIANSITNNNLLYTNNYYDKGSKLYAVFQNGMDMHPEIGRYIQADIQKAMSIKSKMNVYNYIPSISPENNYISIGEKWNEEQNDNSDDENYEEPNEVTEKKYGLLRVVIKIKRRKYEWHERIVSYYRDRYVYWTDECGNWQKDVIRNWYERTERYRTYYDYISTSIFEYLFDLSKPFTFKLGITRHGWFARHGWFGRHRWFSRYGWFTPFYTFRYRPPYSAVPNVPKG